MPAKYLANLKVVSVIDYAELCEKALKNSSLAIEIQYKITLHLTEIRQQSKELII
jgi:hypothetical protein